MDKAELLKIAASLSPEERAAVFGHRPTAPTGQQPWKWQHIADGLPEADVARVVNACRAGIRHSAENPDGGAGADELAGVSPVLASAARQSANYRGKPYEASLASIANYLQSEAFQQRRAAAARWVPPAENKKPEKPEKAEKAEKAETVTPPQGGGR